MKFQTLYAIVNDEIDKRTTNAKNSATDALLWLKRYFIIDFFNKEFSLFLEHLNLYHVFFMNLVWVIKL